MTCRTIAAVVLMLMLATPSVIGARSLETEDEKALYALGAFLSRGLGGLHLTPADVEAIELGVRDGALGRQPRFSLENYSAKLEELLQSRTADVLESETRAAADFLAAEGRLEGATTSDSGVIKRVLRSGDGPSPKTSDRVRLQYHGTLRDGTVFDSSLERGEPVVVPVEGILPCWSEALTSMKVEEKSRFVCPATQAFGARGAAPGVPPGAAVAFEFELLDIVEQSTPSATSSGSSR